MRKILPLLSLALIAVVYSGVYTPSDAQTLPNTVKSASKQSTFSVGNHKAVQLSPEYAQFAKALEDYNAKQVVAKSSVVQKGKKRSFEFTASVLPVEPVKPTQLPVFDHDDILPKHRELANRALTSLPERCWHTLENFYVRYDNPKSRGLAGADTMILSGNVPDKEFYALFMHEIGHVFDLNQDPTCLGGTVAAGRSEFNDGNQPMYNDDVSLEFYRISWLNETTRKPEATAADFVSGYAAHDVFEDFAESHTFFVLHNEEFAKLAQTNTALRAKYTFFATHLYPGGITVANSEYSNQPERPWDTTKLPFTLL